MKHLKDNKLLSVLIIVSLFLGMVTATTITTTYLDTPQLRIGGTIITLDQNLTTTDAPTFATLDTGQGDNELYAMNQDLESTDAVTFSSIDSDTYYVDTENVTEVLSIAQGATAWVGTNSYLDYLPNYWVVDGTADQVQIQAAVDYVNGLGGGTVNLQGYTDYSLSASINPKSDAILKGEGWSTVLQLANGANTNPISWTANTTYFEIRDLAIDGNKAQQDNYDSDRDERSGIYVNSTYEAINLRLENLYLHDIRSGAAIRLYNSENVVIENCLITDCGVDTVNNPSDAIYIGNSTGIKIDGLWVDDVTDTGVALCNTENGIVQNFDIRNINIGLAVHNEYDDKTYPNYNIFSEGYIENSTYRSLVVTKDAATSNLPDHTTISNVNIFNTTDTTLLEIWGLNTHIKGCTVGGWNSAIGIWLGDGNGKITGNTFQDLNYGITFNISGSHPYIIRDNRFSNVGTEIQFTYPPDDYTLEDNIGFTTEKHGTAEASNDDYIAHGLDSLLNVAMGNCTVLLTVQESDAPYSCQVKAVNGTHFQLYLYDIVAAGAEAVDKTIDWYAVFEP